MNEQPCRCCQCGQEWLDGVGMLAKLPCCPACGSKYWLQAKELPKREPIEVDNAEVFDVL